MVNLVVGVFDLFTYAIAGGLYLALAGYVASRVDLVDLAALNGTNGVLLVIGAVVLSYLCGIVAYPLGAAMNKLLPGGRGQARTEFLRRNPTARDRPFVRADSFLLLSALQMHDMDAATEVNRLRASGLMARNSGPALALASVTALVEVFTSGHPVPALVCAVVFAPASVLLILEGRRLGHMASIKTLELCFWLPGIDDRIRSAKP
jgi:hypothetical protein